MQVEEEEQASENNLGYEKKLSDSKDENTHIGHQDQDFCQNYCKKIKIESDDDISCDQKDTLTCEFDNDLELNRKLDEDLKLETEKHTSAQLVSCQDLKQEYLSDSELSTSYQDKWPSLDVKVDVHVDSKCELQKSIDHVNTFSGNTSSALITKAKQKKMFCCTSCNYKTMYKSTMSYHERFKHWVRSYQCSSCSYESVHKRSLLNHVRSKHTEGKSYQCSSCDYVSLKKQLLLNHIKTKHTEEKSFQCPSCDYASLKKCDLLCHIQLKHAGKTAYQCSSCGYKSVTKASLLCHIRAEHTKEKPYQCSLCDFASVRREYLSRHIKSRHSQQV